MARKLETDDEADARWRLLYCTAARDAVGAAIQYLQDARAPQALKRVRALKKSLQGAVNHARRRHRAAQRVAADSAR